jgi:hypothetical protein
VIVVCSNAECENYAVPIDVEPPVDEDTGEVSTGWQGVVCGPCGQWLHTA